MVVKTSQIHQFGYIKLISGALLNILKTEPKKKYVIGGSTKAKRSPQ